MTAMIFAFAPCAIPKTVATPWKIKKKLRASNGILLFKKSTDDNLVDQEDLEHFIKMWSFNEIKLERSIDADHARAAVEPAGSACEDAETSAEGSRPT